MVSQCCVQIISSRFQAYIKNIQLYTGFLPDFAGNRLLYDLPLPMEPHLCERFTRNLPEISSRERATRTYTDNTRRFVEFDLSNIFRTHIKILYMKDGENYSADPFEGLCLDRRTSTAFSIGNTRQTEKPSLTKFLAKPQNINRIFSILCLSYIILFQYKSPGVLRFFHFRLSDRQRILLTD